MNGPQPDPADAIAKLAREHNRELAFEATIAGALGALLTLFIFGAIFLLTMGVMWRLGAASFLEVWIAIGVVALFGVVAFWSAWRQVDPIRDGLPDARIGVSLMISSEPIVLRAQAVSGVAAVILGGPANLLDARSIWARRLRADRPQVSAAADLLKSCASGRSFKEVSDMQSLQFLRRLGLLKVAEGPHGGRFEVTAKGAALLGIDALPSDRTPAVA